MRISLLKTLTTAVRPGMLIVCLLSMTGNQAYAQQPASFSSAYAFSYATETVSKARSPELALGLSVFNTVTPFLVNNLILRDRQRHESTRLLLSAYGLLIGPSTGYIYGRHYGRAVGGFMVRTLGMGVSFLGLGIAVNDAFFRGGDGNQLLPAILFYGGLGLTLYSGISDFFRIQRVVTARNEQYAAKYKLSISPFYAGKQQGLGFALQLRR